MWPGPNDRLGSFATGVGPPASPAMSAMPPVATKFSIAADRLTVRNAPSLDGLFFGLLRRLAVIPSSSDRSRPWRSGLCCGCGKLVSLDDAIPFPRDQRILVAHGMAVFGRLGSREPPKHWLSSASVAAVPGPSVSSASI